MEKMKKSAGAKWCPECDCPRVFLRAGDFIAECSYCGEPIELFDSPTGIPEGQVRILHMNFNLQKPK